MILKLDFQKAYDTVSWNFLDQVLDCMGFGSKWRNWIQHFVSTASMLILINGSPSFPFKIHRGLRQEDPLSPFLFVLIGEDFNKMVEKAKQLNLIHGIQVGHSAMELSHLQFANDTLIFFPKSKECILNARRLLDYFSVMSGLHINYSKSALFPFNCNGYWVNEVQQSLGCNNHWDAW